MADPASYSIYLLVLQVIHLPFAQHHLVAEGKIITCKNEGRRRSCFEMITLK